MKRRPNTGGYLSNDAYTRRKIQRLCRGTVKLTGCNLSEEEMQLIEGFDGSPKEYRELEKRGLARYL